LVVTAVKISRFICSQCGKETEWDEALGPQPLCIDCWDKTTDNWNPRAAYQRRYRQEHKKVFHIFDLDYREICLHEKDAIKMAKNILKIAKGDLCQ